MKAITYARWSSAEQTGGSTLQRQDEQNERYCKARGYTIIARDADEGVSAYTGSNIKTGNLGKLTARLERDGGTGIVLVVEKLDRLSRRPPLEMITWLQRFTATGAKLETADGKHQISADDLVKNMMGIFGVILEAFVGFEESDKKSARGLENWRIKRDSGKPLTAMCPAWLKLSEDRASFQVIEERASLVRRMFRMTLAGSGKSKIAATFNEEGIETWGRGKRKGNGWHASYIQKILRNSAVIGEVQHGTKRRSDERRTKTGDVIRDYFPAIIDIATFQSVNDAKRFAINANQGRGQPLANIFSGIARCGECGGSMTMRAKGPAKRSGGHTVREDYLVCDNAIRNRGCEHRIHFNYGALQRAVLDRLLVDALDDQHFQADDQVAPIEMEVATLRRELLDVERRVASQLNRLEANASDGLDDPIGEDRYRELLRESRALRLGLDEAQDRLVKARGQVSPSEHLVRVSELRQLLDSDDDAVRFKARTSVKHAFRDLIGKMECFDNFTNITLVASRRYISFDRSGRLGADFDLVGSEPETAAQEAIIEGYVRRRSA